MRPRALGIYPEGLFDENRCGRRVFGLVVRDDAAVQKYFGRKHPRHPQGRDNDDETENSQHNDMRDASRVSCAERCKEGPPEPRLTGECNEQPGGEEHRYTQGRSGYVEHEEDGEVYGCEPESGDVERIRHIAGTPRKRTCGRPQERCKKHNPGKGPNDTRRDKGRRNGADSCIEIGVPKDSLINARGLIESPFTRKRVWSRPEEERGRLRESGPPYSHGPLPRGTHFRMGNLDARWQYVVDVAPKHHRKYSERNDCHPYAMHTQGKSDAPGASARGRELDQERNRCGNGKYRPHVEEICHQQKSE